MAAVLLLTASRYGLHGDELYFRMLPVAWWYDDQPPLTVWLSRAAAAVSDGAWVQRLPAIVAAVVGVLLAARTARAVGCGPAAQRVAAWAHAGTVYPLIVGHVFLTSSIDLVVWQAVLLLVVVAVRGRPQALAWAGAVAGLGCWNKLLVVVLVAAVAAALALTRSHLLRTRWAVVGVVAFLALGGVQLGAQLTHGMPMSRVSGDLVARHGTVNRLLVLPLLVAFVGPPYLGVWWRGALWRPPAAAPGAPAPSGLAAPSLPVLAVTGALVTAWNLAFPAQPYYAVAAFLPALAIGWGVSQERATATWRRRRAVVAVNSLVALALSLPWAPTASPAYRLLAAVNPVQRDQAGWPGYVAQVADVRRTGAAGEVGVVTDSYALAGALARYGHRHGISPDHVASGHNALWDLGPPRGDEVLLVGPLSVQQRRFFAGCEPAGSLAPLDADPFGVAGSPMLRCAGPLGGWAAVWPHVRHLGG